jgi:shikimate kinase
MGCGKSTIARALSRKLGFYFIDTDALIESYEGSEIVKIFAKHGEQYFRDLEKLTFTWMKGSLINSVVATGGGFVTSTADLSPLGTTVFIDLSLEGVKKRLSGTQAAVRPLADADIDRLYHSRYGLYEKMADIRIEADGKDLDMITSEILQHL